MSERQDKNERQAILELYAPAMTRCKGGRIVHADYVCHWCGSDDPQNECKKPRRKPINKKC